MTPEQNTVLSRAVYIHSEASGLTAAASRGILATNPVGLRNLAESLRAIAGGTSPLADEIDGVAALLPQPQGNENTPPPWDAGDLEVSASKPCQ